MSSLPLYQHLRNRIFNEFLERTPQPVGAKLPTERELEKKYGASRPTVGKAVAALVAEGWLTKRQGSGIYVAALPGPEAARVSRNQRHIGCIVPNLRLPLAQRIFEGVERIVREQRCVVEVANSEGNFKEERCHVEAMQRRGVHGVVLYPTGERPPHDEYLGKDFRNFPIVVVDLYQPPMKRPHLIFDNWTAGRDMTRWLIEQGHQRIAFLKFDAALPYRSVDDRAAGYCRAMNHANLPEQLLVFPCQLSRTEEHARALHQVLNRFLALTTRPTALIVPDDYHAHAAVMFFRSHGLEAPADVCVAGFDNLQAATWGVRFPSTNPDFVRMGERAVETLLECIATHSFTPSEVVLPCPVVVPPGDNYAWRH